MVKKYRNIIVDGIKYAYTIKHGGDGDGGNYLKIWKDKKILMGWNINGSIILTPKYVADKIKEKIYDKKESSKQAKQVQSTER